jgi:hypothetical protein
MIKFDETARRHKRHRETNHLCEEVALKQLSAITTKK